MSRVILVAAVIVAALPGAPAQATAADTLPHTTMVSPSDVGDDFTFTLLTDQPVVRYECRVDDEPFEWCNTFGSPRQWVLHRQTTGFHVAQVRAIGNWGEVEDPPASSLIYWTPGAPHVTPSPDWDPFGSSHWIDTSRPTFRVRTDDPQVTSVVCAVDSDELVPCSEEWPSPRQLSDGTHDVKAYSIDTAGVWSARPSTTRFAVDTEPPVLSVLAPARMPARTPVKVKIKAMDANLTFKRCDLDEAPIDCRSQTFEHLKPGLHKIFAEVTDVAGNDVRARAKIRVGRRR